MNQQADRLKLPEKVLKYETFLNEVLKVQLKSVFDDRTKVGEEIADLRRLKTTTAAFRIHQKKSDDGKPLKTRVDIGCGFLMNAAIPKTDTICVAVGFGFFAELTLDEADAYVDKKIKLLEEKQNESSKRANEIKADIRLVLEGLRELQSLPGAGFDEKQREEDYRKRILDLWS